VDPGPTCRDCKTNRRPESERGLRIVVTPRRRLAYLIDRFPEQPRDLIERAAGSEDAFDAAVSALVMGAHAQKLETLPSLSDDVHQIEGKIWRPT
jgi:hypothetical protein